MKDYPSQGIILCQVEGMKLRAEVNGLQPKTSIYLFDVSLSMNPRG